MERLTLSEVGQTKKIIINNPSRSFTIVFLIIMFFVFIGFYLFNLGNFSSNYRLTILFAGFAILAIVALAFIPPKTELIKNNKELNVTIVNPFYFKNNYKIYINNQHPMFIAKHPLLSIVGNKEGIVKGYRYYLKYNEKSNEKRIELFSGFGTSTEKDIYNLSKKELEQISNFLNIKLVFE